MLGCQHFFIYDDDSTDGTDIELQGYIDIGIVTMVKFIAHHVRSRQFLCMEDFLFRFSHLTQYIMQADVDCFLLLLNRQNQASYDLRESINEIFSTNPKMGQLQVKSGVFSAGEYEEIPELITQQYICRARDIQERFMYRGRSIDGTLSIAKIPAISGCQQGTHSWRLNSVWMTSQTEKILFAHYKVLSLKSIAEKFEKTAAWNPYPIEEWRTLSKTFCEVKDTRWTYYGDRLRTIMKSTYNSLLNTSIVTHGNSLNSLTNSQTF